MAAPRLKLMLLDETNEDGNGLNAIRKHELIDITGYEDAMSFATCTSNASVIVKDNVTYNMCKSYLDLDNNQVVMIGIKDVQPYDIIK